MDRLQLPISVLAGLIVPVAACSVTDEEVPLRSGPELSVLDASGKADTIAEGQSLRVTSVHTGYCVDVAGASTADAANVLSWPCHGGDNQHWQPVPTDDGESFLLVDQNAGKCLDVYGASTEPGANVILYSCHGGLNQRWRFERSRTDGKADSYRIVDQNSEMCLDVAGASDAWGANLMVYPCHDGPNQRFVLEDANGPAPELGRSVTPLLTMSNPRIDPGLSEALTVHLARLAMGPYKADAILVVRDDAHAGEFAEDPQYVAQTLAAALGGTSQVPGPHVDFIEEPAEGLRYTDVEDYDLVWFSNPGHAIDDARTLRTLHRYFALGNGVVLQGDDMSHWTESLSHLVHVDNGTDFCGAVTNDNEGESFAVTLSSESWEGKLWGELAGETFLYGDDIDVSEPLGQGELILGWATLEGGDACGWIPTIVGRGSFTPPN